MFIITQDGNAINADYVKELHIWKCSEQSVGTTALNGPALRYEIYATMCPEGRSQQPSEVLIERHSNESSAHAAMNSLVDKLNRAHDII